MLGKIHLYFGIIIVVIFLLTGQYMHHNYNHLKDMEIMNRVLFRTGHLYILLFGLVHISLGAYFEIPEKKWLMYFQALASVLIFIASVLVIGSFFYELPANHIERPLARYSLYLILAGVSFHGIIALIQKK